VKAHDERYLEQPWTWRAHAIGLALSAFIGFATIYNLMVIHGSYTAIDFSAAAAAFLLFLCALPVNGVAARLSPRLALTAAELRLVYVMMLVACAIPTMGLTAQLMPIITSAHYFATPENSWAETVQPHLPRWLVPQGAKAIRDFYEGSPGGSGAVPWGAWMRPLLMWSVFLAALYATSIAVMVIVRRQWMDHERLVYPLAQLPIEMSQRTPGRAVGPFFTNTAMWAGFVVAALNGALTGLHHYFPTVPSLRPELVSIPILRNTEWLRFRLSLPMLGFFFLVHLDVAFSVWFFNLFSLAVRGVLRIYSVHVVENLGIYGARSPIFAHLGMGAMVVLVLAGLWTGRHHLRGVFLRALRRDAGVDDATEAMSYRAAAVVLCVSISVMVVWLRATGIPLWVTVLFLLAALILFYGLTRVVAESGMAEAVASTTGSSFVVSGFGAGALGPPGLAALSLTYVWSADIRTFAMASVANGLKIVDGPTGRRRRILWSMVGAIVACFVASAVTMLYLSYRYGGINGNSWFFGGGARAPYDYAVSKILNPEGPNVAGWIFKGIGAGAMGLLMLLRTRFLWFPFHPIGFAIGPIWIMDHIWVTVFLAWALKLSILRWGGVRLYGAARPFFLGLILGQFTCNGSWLIVDAITGAKGNLIFWI
jgi:hypothetical protein